MILPEIFNQKGEKGMSKIPYFLLKTKQVIVLNCFCLLRVHEKVYIALFFFFKGEKYLKFQKSDHNIHGKILFTVKVICKLS